MSSLLNPKNITPRILVVGDIMLDTYWISDVERISPEAPVPIARVLKKPIFKLGGAGNVASNLANLGAVCGLLTIVGNDNLGETLKKMLSELNIEDHSITSKNHKTIEKIRVISRGQQILRVDKENEVNKPIDIIVDIFQKIIPNYDFVIFSDYNKGSLYEIQKLIDICRKKNIKTFIDPKSTSFKKYSGAYLIKPNLSELKAAVPSIETSNNYDEIIVRFLKLNKNNYLLLTKSQDGMVLYGKKGKLIDISSDTKEVYDVTGAGDTVISSLVYFLAIGHKIQESTEIANLSASIVVTKLGTSSVSLKDINDAWSYKRAK